ncbi:MAG: hypothetical protein R3D85_02735 [Paracoccaceae bacterium]
MVPGLPASPEPGPTWPLAQDAGHRVAGGWQLSGSKTWTFYTQYANWIFCLVRTDPEVKKQEGILDDAGGRTWPPRRLSAGWPIRLMDGTE